MILRVTQRVVNDYFQGFSDLSLRGKVTRLAFPAIAGLVGLVCCAALAYRLIHYLNPPVKKPEDTSIPPLKLSDEQHAKATPKKLETSILAYQLDLHEIFPQTVHSYVHALGPEDNADRTRFIQTAVEKAGFLVTIWGTGQYSHLEQNLAHINASNKRASENKVASGCTSYELSIPNGNSYRTLWHLHIDIFSKDFPLDTLHQTLETIDKFITDKGVDLTNKPIMVSSSFPADAALFILYHQLYNQLKKLVEKESKDQTVAEIAHKVLQNFENDIQTLLEDRLRLIKKLLPHLKIEIHPAKEIEKYRSQVLLPLIRRMRESSAAPVLAPLAPTSLPTADPKTRSVLSKEQKIEKKLEMLAGFKDLLAVDPDQSWEEWNKFISQMQQCYEQLIPLCSNSSIDSYLEIWRFICKVMPIAHCHNFYKAMLKRTENDQICRLYRDFTFQKLREQGYLINQVNKEGRCLLGFYSSGLLKTLQAWYENKQPEKAQALQRFIEDLERHLGVDNPGIEPLLQPLKDLEKGPETAGQFELFNALIAAYEKEPKVAVKDYLKKVLAASAGYIINNLIRKSGNRQELFVLLGECLTTSNRAYLWLEVLYREPIDKYGSELVASSSYDGLDPTLYSKVKDSLTFILSNQAYLYDIIGGNQGRVAIACMWVQMDEEILLKAAELIFNSGIKLDLFIPNSALPKIWEKFASDPDRIKKHPEICDWMLEVVFKIWVSPIERKVQKERLPILEASHWNALQANDKLPRLRAAYQAAL